MRETSARNRILFPLILVALVLSIAEFGAYLLVSFERRAPFSWAENQAARVRIIAENEREEASGHAVVHPYLGFVLRPPEIVQVARGQRRSAPVSSFGFPHMTRSPIHDRAPDKAIIGILGASVAADFFDVGRSVLERELRSAGILGDRQIVFTNLAMGGYKQPQQLLVLSYLLTLGAEFDILINIDGFNEVALHEAENANKGVYPAFPRGWYAIGTKIPDPSLRSLIGELGLLRSRRKQLARSFSGALLQYSVIANRGWQALDLRNRANQARVEQAFLESGIEGGDYAASGPERNFQTRDELYEFLADVWQRGSIQLAQLSRANAIRYYHFLQPNQYLEGAKPLTPKELEIAFLATHPYRVGVERGYPRLRRRGVVLSERGVRFKDLTQIFAGRDEDLYIDTCCHLNERGYEIMGRHIAEAIAADWASEL